MAQFAACTFPASHSRYRRYRGLQQSIAGAEAEHKMASAYAIWDLYAGNNKGDSTGSTADVLFQYHPMTSQYHSKNSEGLACNLSPEAQSTSLWLDMTMTNFGAPQTLCWSSNWWWRRGDNFFLAPEAIAPIGSGTPLSKDVVVIPPINHLRTSPTPILVIAASFGTAKSLMGSKSSPGCYQLWWIGPRHWPFWPFWLHQLTCPNPWSIQSHPWSFLNLDWGSNQMKTCKRVPANAWKLEAITLTSKGCCGTDGTDPVWLVIMETFWDNRMKWTTWTKQTKRGEEV